MKQIFMFISISIICSGLYLKFFYDVPDTQEQINFFVSWFLIIIGTSSLLINVFWNHKKNISNQE